MKVTFYRNNSDNKTVRKSLTQIGSTLDCWIKDNCGMLRPTIKIERSALNSFAGVNYFYIDTFNRYYNIVEDIAMVGDFISISGEVDPLYSNMSAILNLTCVVLRQENRCNKMYQDSELPIRAKKTFAYKMLGSIPNNMTYLLTVDGGK